MAGSDKACAGCWEFCGIFEHFAQRGFGFFCSQALSTPDQVEIGDYLDWFFIKEKMKESKSDYFQKEVFFAPFTPSER